MAPPQLTIEHDEGIPVARVVGELDKLAADTVRVRLTPLVETGSLVVDLGGVTFVDSAGLHMLFGLARASSGTGRVAIALGSSPVRRVVELVHLAETMPVCGTVREAIEAARKEHASGRG